MFFNCCQRTFFYFAWIKRAGRIPETHRSDSEPLPELAYFAALQSRRGVGPLARLGNHLCLGASGADRSAPLAPVSDDLKKGKNRKQRNSVDEQTPEAQKNKGCITTGCCSCSAAVGHRKTTFGLSRCIKNGYD